jgi:hypothetical protein
VIVVEDGTGLATSVSYGSVSGADAYHLARGTTAWAGTEAAKEAALIRATQALDGRYRWPGIRHSETQALDWPRDAAYDVDGYEIEGLPQGVIDATYEAALIELLEPGALSPTVDTGVRSEKVGSINIDYFGTQRTGYTKIGHCLRRIVRAGSGGISIVRMT